jgi:hypothetical protein
LGGALITNLKAEGEKNQVIGNPTSLLRFLQKCLGLRAQGLKSTEMLNFPGRQSTRRRGGKATPSWMAPQQQQNQQQQQKVRPFNGEIRTRAYTTSYGR